MAARSNLEILLEFLGRPLVWVTFCVAAALVAVSYGWLDLALLRQVLDVLGGFLSGLKFW